MGAPTKNYEHSCYKFYINRFTAFEINSNQTHKQKMFMRPPAPSALLDVNEMNWVKDNNRAFLTGAVWYCKHTIVNLFAYVILIAKTYFSWATIV